MSARSVRADLERVSKQLSQLQAMAHEINDLLSYTHVIQVSLEHVVLFDLMDWLIEHECKVMPQGDVVYVGTNSLDTALLAKLTWGGRS